MVILHDTGFIRGSEGSALAVTDWDFLLEGMTWEGHEFAENAKDSGIWSQAKEKAGSVSLSIISDLLKAIIASKIAGA